MRKTVHVSIGNSPYILNEDAYIKLDIYLKNFRSRMDVGIQATEVMEDLELRIAEILNEKLQNSHQIVNIEMVNSVIMQMGMPDGSEPDSSYGERAYPHSKGGKRFFRDTDDVVLGGVCSGCALYFNINLTIVRFITIFSVFFLPLLFAYIILWIIVPEAKSPAEKCLLRGLPLTPENLTMFTYSN